MTRVRKLPREQKPFIRVVRRVMHAIFTKTKRSGEVTVLWEDPLLTLFLLSEYELNNLEIGNKAIVWYSEFWLERGFEKIFVGTFVGIKNMYI